MRLIDAEELTQVELGQLLAVLPPRVAEAICILPDQNGLLEVVLDLGRLPEARFATGDVTLDQNGVTREDLEEVVRRVGDFGDDNRAGCARRSLRLARPEGLWSLAFSDPRDWICRTKLCLHDRN